MKIYTNQKTKMSVVSGKALAVSDDRKTLTVKTQEFNRDTKVYEDKEMVFEAPAIISICS